MVVREQNGTPRRNTIETRDRIIEDATTLFAEHGYHGTGISDIAEKVGLRGGALYYHIGSKQELLWEILSRYTAAVLAEAEDVAVSGRSATDRLHDLIVGQLRLIISSTRQMQIEMRDRSSLSEDRLAELQAMRERIQAIWQETLDQGCRTGEFASADSVVTNTVITTVNSVAHWYREGGRLSADDIAERVAAVVLHGVVGPGQSPTG